MKAVVGRLGTVSSGQTLADQRKFFEPPDVVQVRGGTQFSSVPNYDLVTIASGDRANPLGRNVQDRFFAFRDAVIGHMRDGDVASGDDPDGIADNFTSLQAALDSPLTVGDLFDVTDIVEPAEGADLAHLQSGKGYYLDLVEPGEKGLSSPVTIEGILLFTTYLPEQVVDVATCSLIEGSGLLYAINVLDGSAAINWDELPDSDPLAYARRTYALGSGIPSSVVPIFHPDGVEGMVGSSGGASFPPLGLGLPRSRTFWFEETGL